MFVTAILPATAMWLPIAPHGSPWALWLTGSFGISVSRHTGAFDRLWRSGLMTKKEAYQWMQTEFGLHEEQAHIAQFGAYMCDRLICACDKFRIHSAEVA